MDDARRLLRHALATLAYRTQKALRGAPASFGDFRASEGVRTPVELVRHMSEALAHGCRHLDEIAGEPGGQVPRRAIAAASATLDEEVRAFHGWLEALGERLDAGGAGDDLPWERLLQGPLSDAMTHVGQLAMLRRLAGSPVPKESFFAADVRADRLGPDQPPPARPKPND